MKQSQLFTRTKKEAPADEVAKNAELLIRGGFIHKELAGVYSFLPLGLRVLENITKVVREEMNAIGGQQVSLPALQDKALWEKTNRWDDNIVDNWFKTTLKSGGEVGLGFSHEEPLTNLLTEYVSSYKDLPFSVYQFQTKFRNEMRAKSGIMRGREFLMKDMYSFSKDKNEHDLFYEAAKGAYKKVFTRLGIGHITYLTFASGGVFSKYSHEFQTVSAAGEDTIYIDEEKGMAINNEVYTDDVLASLGVDKSKLKEERAIEVGNIFELSSRYSEPLGLTYTDAEDAKVPVFMGCYGMGISRLMGTIVETLSDDKGIIWPKEVAPFAAHVLILGEKETTREKGMALYESLKKSNIEVLVDDRSGLSAGEKFADADLIGIPMRIVVSDRSIENGGYEVKGRTEEKGKVMSSEEVVKLFQK